MSVAVGESPRVRGLGRVNEGAPREGPPVSLVGRESFDHDHRRATSVAAGLGLVHLGGPNWSTVSVAEVEKRSMKSR